MYKAQALGETCLFEVTCFGVVYKQPLDQLSLLEDVLSSLEFGGYGVVSGLTPTKARGSNNQNANPNHQVGLA